MLGRVVKSTALLWILLALFFSPGCVAAEAGDFSLHGFGTLGWAASSSADAEFVRDLSQTSGISGGDASGRIDNIFGVQANWIVSSDWEMVAQAVSRLHYDKTRDPELMLAFAKWEPNAQLSWRFGRIGADFMMRADSRLIGYSFLPVRPQVDFFGPLFFSHLDGADVALALPVAGGILRGKLFYGRTHEKAAGSPGIWDTSGSPVSGWVAEFTTGRWLWRANYAQIRYANQIRTFGIYESLPVGSAAREEMTTKDKVARFVSVGAVFEDGPLQIQGMVNKINQESGVFQDSQAGFLLGSYRLGQVTPYAGISRWYTNNQQYASADASYQSFMRASHAEQTTYSLGARWDAWANVALKFQYDAVRGKPGSKFPYATQTAQWNGRTDVLSMTMDFVF